MNLDERERRAKEVLDNPIYNEIWQVLEAKLRKKWETSSIEDSETREQCYLLLSSLKAHRALIEKVILGKRVAILPTKRQRRRQEAKEAIK